MLLPLHIDVTHFFSCDALFIQKDIFGVPDDHTQDVPKREIFGARDVDCSVKAARGNAVCGDTHFLALRGVMLNGGPGGPKLLGKTSTHICSFPYISEKDGLFVAYRFVTP